MARVEIFSEIATQFNELCTKNDRKPFSPLLLAFIGRVETINIISYFLLLHVLQQSMRYIKRKFIKSLKVKKESFFMCNLTLIKSTNDHQSYSLTLIRALPTL